MGDSGVTNCRQLALMRLYRMVVWMILLTETIRELTLMSRIGLEDCGILFVIEMKKKKRY